MYFNKIKARNWDYGLVFKIINGERQSNHRHC